MSTCQWIFTKKRLSGENRFPNKLLSYSAHELIRFSLQDFYCISHLKNVNFLIWVWCRWFRWESAVIPIKCRKNLWKLLYEYFRLFWLFWIPNILDFQKLSRYFLYRTEFNMHVSMKNAWIRNIDWSLTILNLQTGYMG